MGHTPAGLALLFSAALALALVPAVQAYDSPSEQFRAGTAIEDIVCSEGRILLESPRGRPACVSPGTYDVLLERGYSPVMRDTAPGAPAPGAPAPGAPASLDGSTTPVSISLLDKYLAEDEPADDGHLPLKERLRNLVVQLRDNETIIHTKEHPKYKKDGTYTPRDEIPWDLYPKEDYWDPATETFSTYPFVPTPEQLAHIQNITNYNLYVPSSSYMIKHTDALPRIENHGGDWVPIRDKEAFVDKLVAATGDSRTGPERFMTATSNFPTEKGLILLRDQYLPSRPPFVEAIYYINEVLEGEDDRIEFVDTFMENMGYEWTTKAGTPMSMRYWVDNCKTPRGHDTPDTPECQDPYTSVGYWPISSTRGDSSYNVHQKYSTIYFKMFPSKYVGAWPTIQIFIDGWTNNPRDVPIQLDRYEAFKKAYAFAANTFELNRPTDHEEKHYWHCNWKFVGEHDWVINPQHYEFEPGISLDPFDDIDIKTTVIAGVPYYKILLGTCEYDYDEGVPIYSGDAHEYSEKLVFVDAWIGEHVFLASRAWER